MENLFVISEPIKTTHVKLTFSLGIEEQYYSFVWQI